MALRLPIKINSKIIQNLGKVFYSGKPTAKPNCNLSETATRDGSIQKKPIYGSHAPSSPMQQVQMSSDGKVSEADIIQKAMEKNHLQPSKLAEYYKPTTNINTSTYAKLGDSELGQSKGGSQYREFAKSTTYKNVKLPLKKPRLASPFPDPVKAMPSDTLSDQEKADLKEAEARGTKSDFKTAANMTQCRNYSTVGKNDDKCKKVTKKKKGCPAVKTPCKKPAKKKICDDTYRFKKCKKKKAPYQAYSEFCHTIPDEKPSECKICPWRPSEHPTFKPPKKKFHTSAAAFSPRKRIYEKFRMTMDRKNGWIEREKWRKVDISSMEPAPEICVNSMLCKKNPCKPPKNKCKRVEKDKDKSKKKKKGDKKKQKEKKPKKSKKPGKSKKPKKKAAVVDNSRSWVTLVDPKSVQELPTIFNHRTVPYFFKKKHDKGEHRRTFKKFPFRGCNIKKRKKDDKPKCKKTKIRNKRGVADCPPETCKETAPWAPPTYEYLLEKSKKPKCPKISPGKCQKEEGDGPCGEKRKGTTRRCPTDLLKKKRRKPPKPKKKTQSGIGSSLKPCDYNMESSDSKLNAKDMSSKTDQFCPPSPSSFDYLLDKPKKPKCPAVETDKCKEEEDTTDPCGLKRKGKTKECPSDLLKKKRRKPAKPKKKTMPVITPPVVSDNSAQPTPSTSSQP